MKEGGCGTENEELRMLYGPKPEERHQKRNEFRYRLYPRNARAIFTRGQGRVVDSECLARVPAKKGRRKGYRACGATGGAVRRRTGGRAGTGGRLHGVRVAQKW